MRLAPKLLLIPALLLMSGGVQAQEDLLWKADNTITPTLVPVYQNWAAPFKVKARQADTGTPEDERRRREASAQAQAAAAQAAAAAAEAERARLEKITAEKKAQAIASSPDAVVANLSGLEAEGVVQGPLGNSMLWQNRWFKEGTQLRVSTTMGPIVAKRLENLNQTDTLTAGLVDEKIKQRLSRQTEISLTLVQITSASAIFSDGQRRYTLPVSQPPF